MLCYSYCVVPEKNRYSPHGRSLEIPRGKGVLKAKILQAKYEAKLESLDGGVHNRKTFCGGEKIFSDTTHYTCNEYSKYRERYWSSSIYVLKVTIMTLPCRNQFGLKSLVVSH